ncbi:hypothetical protein POTOM_011659 [Populus tomentosa]|uniref:GOST seven transmembrane domain-containing protein n=1 Tax=Populus tomentosa TaxID=118781 RepID=A0A8X8A851_POPTO|nr:hypothetical protein POTOM_011659 [Populus tomentosa]
MVFKELPVCCTADLAKLGVCSEGEIIHRPSTKNPGWPQVFGVAFYAHELVATLPSKSIQISRTGMYNFTGSCPLLLLCLDYSENVGIFVASEVLELVENVGAVSDLSGNAKLFLVLPVAFLDAFIFIWMFKSLSAI